MCKWLKALGKNDFVARKGGAGGGGGGEWRGGGDITNEDAGEHSLDLRQMMITKEHTLLTIRNSGNTLPKSTSC